EHAPDLIVADLDRKTGDMHELPLSDLGSALGALTLGTADYARRCGFQRALLGLSGGIDSALVACVASRALGPENVLGVAMPSRYSSEGSLTDAAATGDAGAEAADLAMQNLQARVRGAILMALSNRHGRLLLTTGNKSELATGYCTLYGDMAGGLAVI